MSRFRNVSGIFFVSHWLQAIAATMSEKCTNNISTQLIIVGYASESSVFSLKAEFRILSRSANIACRKDGDTMCKTF